MTLPLNNPCRTRGIGNEASVEKDGKRTELSYSYDALSRRNGKTASIYENGELKETKTTEYIWYGDKVQYEEVTQNGEMSPKVNMWGMTGIAARNNEIFSSDAHGNTDAGYDGTTSTKRYTYDAYGNAISDNGEDDNPYRYCGENYDEETGLYYLRARYYDPATSRMLSEDTHWNASNMIYGDREYRLGETRIPDINAIMQSSNLYVYCMNNPINYTDPTGHRSKKDADNIIKNNAQNIKDAAFEFGVNPAILAATIYAEQRLNVNWKDDFVDPLASDILDVSLGVGQIRISTAIKLEDKGYMPKTKYYEWHTNNAVENRRAGVAINLQNDKTNIRYAAAYLSYIQDLWKSEYPEIDGRTAILATLYNIGEYGSHGPNSSPKSRPFGDFAKDNYYYMQELLGLK